MVILRFFTASQASLLLNSRVNCRCCFLWRPSDPRRQFELPSQIFVALARKPLEQFFARIFDIESDIISLRPERFSMKFGLALSHFAWIFYVAGVTFGEG